jgi:hypothetical protein
MIEIPITYIPLCIALHVFEIAGILFLLIKEVLSHDN